MFFFSKPFLAAEAATDNLRYSYSIVIPMVSHDKSTRLQERKHTSDIGLSGIIDMTSSFFLYFRKQKNIKDKYLFGGKRKRTSSSQRTIYMGDPCS